MHQEWPDCFKIGQETNIPDIVLYCYFSICQILNIGHLIFFPADTEYWEVIVPTLLNSGQLLFHHKVMNTELEFWVLDIYCSILQQMNTGQGHLLLQTFRYWIMDVYCSILQMLNTGWFLFHPSDPEYWTFNVPSFRYGVCSNLPILNTGQILYPHSDTEYWNLYCSIILILNTRHL